jgi:hypothetical protein
MAAPAPTPCIPTFDLVIIWVSRRHRVVFNGDLDQQSGNALRDARAHDNTSRNVAMGHAARKASKVDKKSPAHKKWRG